MNDELIRNAVRKRFLAASGINPLTQFREQGKKLDTSNLAVVAAEYLISGEKRSFTNKRSGVKTFMIQYDFYVPSGSGLQAAETMRSAVEDEFDLSDPAKSKVAVAGYDVNLNTIKVSRKESSPFDSIQMLFTFSVMESPVE